MVGMKKESFLNRMDVVELLREMCTAVTKRSSPIGLLLTYMRLAADSRILHQKFAL